MAAWHPRRNAGQRGSARTRAPAEWSVASARTAVQPGETTGRATSGRTRAGRLRNRTACSGESYAKVLPRPLSCSPVSAAATRRAASSDASGAGQTAATARRGRAEAETPPCELAGEKGGRWWTQSPQKLFERLQFFARFEPDRLARRDRDLSPGARVAPDTGFARAYVEDSKPPQLNAFTAA